MKKTKRIFTIILALVLALVPAASAYGEGKSTKYIQDLKVGYGATGKELLVEAGYTVWEGLNANGGNYGGPVYVGYKETNDITEAITKVSVMNMNGGYSFTDWINEVESIKEEVSTLLYNISNSIIEFQQRYKKGSEYAEVAYEMLNMIDETDSNTSLGDLLLHVSKPATSAKLNNMFLLANAEILKAVEEIIAYACTDNNQDGTTFLDRIENSTYTGKLDYGYNNERGILLKALDNFKIFYKSMTKSMDAFEKNAKATGYDKVEDYVTTLDLDKQLEYGKYKTLINTLTETEYAGTGYSLLDIVTLKEDDTNIEYSDELFEPLLKSFTSGQIGCLSVVAFETMVLNAVGSKNGETISAIEAMKDEFLEELSELGVESISIYYGVDRSLFEDPSSVALSSAAIRDKASQNGGYFGADKEALKDETLYRAGIGMLIAAGSIAMISGGIWLFSASTTAATEAAAVDWFAGLGLAEMGETLPTTSVSSAATSSSLGVTIAGIVAIVAIIMVIVCIVLLLTGLLEDKTELEDIEYTAIPRAIVDLAYDIDGDKYYVNYYAAKNVAAGENEKDSLALYGDLNGRNKKDQWLVIYYTKDKRVGTPLTTEIFVSNKLENKSCYQGVGELGFEGAMNLNKYSHSSTREDIYLYIKEAKVSGQTGSVFSNGSAVAMSISCFVVGAAIAAVITNKRAKKKYEG